MNSEYIPRNEHSPTVYGVEQEYSLTATEPNGTSFELVGQCHSIDSELDLYESPRTGSIDGVESYQYQEALNHAGLDINDAGFLSNGGRFYIDPSGPEYCTPETTTAAEAVLRTFDGDRIVFGILRQLQKTGSIESFQLNRKIVDHNRSSRGVHINTASSHPSETSREFIEALSALNVAKGSMFGSGGLLVNKKQETEFHHSPRLSLTNHDSIEPPMYTSRALVRHPFKVDVGCRRIETISSDALNFAWPLRASMVMTNAAVKLFEIDEFKGELPVLLEPVSASKQIGLRGHNTIVGIEHRRNTYNVFPAEILRKIAELAIEADKKYFQLDNESRQVLVEVIETADQLKSDPNKLVQRIESIARYEFMARKIKEHQVNWDSEKLCKLDYYWDMIGGGIAETLRDNKGWGWYGFEHVDSTQKRKKRINVPPADTRASLRGRLIKDSKGFNDSTWYDFEQEDPELPNVAMHPLTSEFATK